MSLPPGWAETTLGELGRWRGGGTPSKANAAFWTGGDIPWVSPKDMKADQIGDAEDRITAAAVEGSTTNLVDAGSVLIVVRSGILRRVLPVAVTMREVSLNQDLKALTPHDGVSADFIARLLRSRGTEILHSAAKAGTTVDSLDFERLKQTVVLLPPVGEQRRIVTKLNALTTRLARARGEARRGIKLADRLRSEVQSQAYGGLLTAEWRRGRTADWPILALEEIGDIVTGSTPPTAEKADLFGGDTAFFKPTDLDAGYDVAEPRETLSKAGAARSRIVPARSTLVTCIGATISKTGLTRVACAFNQQINAIVPRVEVATPEWVYWAVTSPQFKVSIIENASATTMPIINKGRFQALSLPVPPIDEQREIVRILEAAFARADRLEAEARKALVLIDRLEAAILARAFRGELVPQDPNDEPASVLLERIRARRAAEPKAKRGRRPKLAS